MSVRRSMGWSLGGNAVSMIATLGSTMVVARLLTPAQMGAFAVGVATLVVIQSMLQVGLAGFLIREKEVDPTLIGSAVGVAALQGVTISALLLLAGPLMGSFQRSAEVTNIVFVIASIPILSSLEAVSIALWSREMNFAAVARLTIIKAVVQGVLSIALAVAGFGASALAAGYLGAAVIGLAFAAPTLLRVRPNLIHWRRLAVFGGVWMLLGGVRALNMRLPEFIIGRFLGLSAAGLYNRAGATADIVWRSGSDPIARVLFPDLARRFHKTGELSSGLVRLSGTLTAILWPVLAGLALLAEPVILVLYGDQWVAAEPVLVLLALWVAIALAGSGAAEALLLLDRLKLSAQIEAGRTAMAFLLLAALAPFGLVAVAAGRVLETAIGVAAYLVAMRRLAGLQVRHWVAGHLASALLAALTVAPVWLFRVLVEQPRSPLLQLAIAGPIFALCYLTAIFLTRHPLSSEVVRALKLARSTLAGDADPTRKFNWLRFRRLD